jgi:hypothetical protein
MRMVVETMRIFIDLVIPERPTAIANESLKTVIV